MQAVSRSVPSSVAPSTGNTVRIDTEPQLGPFQATTGTAVVPAVPQVGAPEDARTQPAYGGVGMSGAEPGNGGGAPSVPGMNGVLFTPGPIDAHYQSEAEAYNPVRRVNSPPTRGMFTRIQNFVNGIATSQDVDNAGWKERHPQQRTSVMRNTLPPHGSGYAPASSAPHQNPQAPNTYKYNPATGTQAYGTGVLNSDTFGAGQTAGGIGGNQYTPVPGPPQTTSTASADIAAGRGMPTWG